eukprot:364834-Chlamydomonas_euryale.AAC.10
MGHPTLGAVSGSGSSHTLGTGMCGHLDSKIRVGYRDEGEALTMRVRRRKSDEGVWPELAWGGRDKKLWPELAWGGRDMKVWPELARGCRVCERRRLAGWRVRARG